MDNFEIGNAFLRKWNLENQNVEIDKKNEQQSNFRSERDSYQNNYQNFVFKDQFLKQEEKIRKETSFKTFKVEREQKQDPMKDIRIQILPSEINQLIE